MRCNPTTAVAEQSREPERRSRAVLNLTIFRRRPVTAGVIPLIQEQFEPGDSNGTLGRFLFC